MIKRLQETEQNKPQTMGYIYMIISTLLTHFTFMIIKESIGITLYQQVLIRGFFQLITNLVPIYYNDSSFEPTLNVSSYIVSAILGGIKFLAIQNGINILNMTEVYTILHLSPIITIILGVIFINEKVTLIDIIQTLLSFTGVILVIKPNFIFNHTHSSKYEDNYQQNLGYLYVFIVVLCQASSYLIMKRMPPNYTIYHILNSFSLGMIIFSSTSILITGEQQPIQPSHYLSFFLVGLLGMLYQNLCTRAIQIYSPAKLMVIRYLSIFYGVFTDYFYYQLTLDPYTYLGAALVFSVTLVIFINNYIKEKEKENKNII